MEKKRNAKMKVDIAMIVMMILVMSYKMTGNLFHELSGMILAVLFVAHNILNRKWYQLLYKGKYSPYRTTGIIVNVLILISMLIAMGTGIYMSESLFDTFWWIREGYLIRPFHVAAGAWGILLISVHIGLHLQSIMVQVKRKIEGKIPNKIAFLIQGIITGVFIVYGIWSFIELEMPARLTFQESSAYWSHSGTLLLIANMSIMVMAAAFTHGVIRLLKTKKIKKNR